MTPLVRVLLSVIYWVAALGLVLFAGYALPGDCFTEQTRSGFDQCINQGRTIHITGLAIALVVYLVLWRLGRRR